MVGRANVACSLAFKRVIERFRQEGLDPIYVYLKRCVLMDSTFLGVLAQQGMALQGEQKLQGRRITLVEPSDRVLDLVDNLGVLEAFEILDSEPEMEFQFEEISDGAESDLEAVTRTSLEAHRSLIELNEENRARFEGVTSLLAKELGEEEN